MSDKWPDEPPGSDEICPICYWQDDASGLRYPTIALGPNKVSLVEAQHNFLENGASEARLRQFVRSPTALEPKDPQWRPFDQQKDENQDARDAWPEDQQPYYWRRKESL